MSDRFDIISTPLAGLTLLQRKPLGDKRGYLERLFCREEIASIIADKTIVQINHTLTVRIGTVRGIHFQYPPHAEIKFVACLRGEVFDVAVDVRHGSPTFLQWHAEILSADNHKTLVIPEGFAHGFQTLTDDCELIYLHTGFYASAAEGAINAGDPRLGIKWPVKITDISDRDLHYPFITDEFKGVEI